MKRAIGYALVGVIAATGVGAVGAQETPKDANPHVCAELTRPLDGARTALKASRVLGRAAGLRFALIERAVPPGSPPAEAVAAAQAEGPAGLFILDLPLEDVVAAGQALAGRDDVILFNVRHHDDRLRGAACSPALFHTLPSQAMAQDALAQYLARQTWRRVLLVVGETDADRETAAAFRAAATKFGLTIAGARAFVLSNDPRERDRTNAALLTGGVQYDVAVLFDTVGEFGRYLPFATQLPRPVVGSEGLTPRAWHWTWERHGAPQLNQRFRKIAKRSMSDTDFAAWAAARAVVEAAVRTGSVAVPDIRTYLLSEALTLDVYKGAPGSFRPWDRQLRQPVLLATHNAVIARAPLEGFLHRRNVLDTLGADISESGCQFNS